MSGIPKSKRTIPYSEFYDKAIYIRQKIMEIVAEDFNDSKQFIYFPVVDKENKPVLNEKGQQKQKRYIDKNFWLKKLIRERLYQYSSNFISEIVAANAVYMDKKSLYSDYVQRRKHQNEAIAQLQNLKQELTFAIKLFSFSANKYVQWDNDINYEIEAIKSWRQSDGQRFTKMKNKISNNNNDDINSEKD